MEMTNTGDLNIESERVYPVVEDGTYEADYKGYKPFKEDGIYGHKEGVRLQFQITKGPFKGQYVSFKGTFFQDNQSGKWNIGRKSKLAEAIRTITGGEKLNKGHEGTRVYIVVTVNTTKTGKNAGKRYSNVSMILALPKDYSAAPAATPAPAAAAPAPAPVAQPAPAPAPAPVAAQAAQTAPQAQPAPVTQPANDDLLGGLEGLDDLSDLGK